LLHFASSARRSEANTCGSALKTRLGRVFL
jgi:hypothetical protein